MLFRVELSGRARAGTRRARSAVRGRGPRRDLAAARRRGGRAHQGGRGCAHGLSRCWRSGTTALRHVSNGVRRDPARRATARGCRSARSTTPSIRRCFPRSDFEPRFIDVKDLGEAVRTRRDRRAGKSADQPRQLRPAQDAPPRQPDRAFLRHRAGARQRGAHSPGLAPAERAALDAAVADATAVPARACRGRGRGMPGAADGRRRRVIGPDAIDLAAFRSAVADVVAPRNASARSRAAGGVAAMNGVRRVQCARRSMDACAALRIV